MIHTILNVVYVLIAISMVVLILLQRGAGASAGSGFGAGASGTVFGARGSANFLSSSTKWLAGLFFAISLFMAWQASHEARKSPQADIGVMSEVPATPQKSALPDAPVIPPVSAPALPTTPVIAPPTTVPATSGEKTPAPAPIKDSKGG